ncbi:NAD(P)H-hydrate dehydratase [uncultured Peptoniphilus sp.]|uniref:NAD(P)H-hydrate dehydratase n=1 Tax=uncultured Peptoniphilus sp. TaxID=254354 RepID=UPI002805D66E|nr:NAD(P)H-hydrate dehydratase [uncultured Peptoniphilus sp.]
MLGIDIVKISRIEKIYKKHQNFLEKIFGEEEIAYIKKRKYPYERIAGLFAAKEAIIKAMDFEFNFSPKEIEILRFGKKPYGFFKGEIFDLSISHEKDYALAIAKKREFMPKVREEFLNTISKRDKNSHKGSYGKIGIIGGSLGMTGSIYLSANASLKAGAGLVYALVPKEIFEVMSIKFVEPIAKAFENNDALEAFIKNLDILAIGPGMGRKESAIDLLKKVLPVKKPLLIDADGLTNLGEIENPFKDRDDFSTVLTPHALEFSRISGYDLRDIENSREDLARAYAKKNKIILVLKGHNTIVTDGERVYINDSGNAGMATAGSGDVLTGIISSLLKILPPYEAAKIGVYVHGLAGDFAKEKYGENSLIARNIIEFLPKAFKCLEKS